MIKPLVDYMCKEKLNELCTLAPSSLLSVLLLVKAFKAPLNGLDQGQRSTIDIPIDF